MKGYFNNRKVHAVAALVIATSVVGCGTITGKKKGSKNKNNAPAAIETSIEGIQYAKGEAIVSYKSSVAGATFACKIDANQWKPCAAEGERVPLNTGKAVKFAVKATANGVEDSTPATADLQDQSFGAVIVEKSQIGATYNRSELKVTFKLRSGDASNARFECKVDKQTAFATCEDQTGYTFTNLEDGGEYRLVVRPVDKTTREAGAEDEITFRVDFSAGDGGGQGGSDPRVSGNAQVFGGGAPLIIGPYAFAVPQDLNVFAYATNRTIGGANIDLFQLESVSDIYAQGAANCQRREVWKTATGRPMSYCRSYERRDIVQWTNNMTITPNFIEVGTDSTKANAANYERISVSVFDSSVEYKDNRSRYLMHCAAGRGDVLESGMVPNVPMVSRYYHGQLPETVDFYWCVRKLTINTQPITVRVGAFINLDGFAGGTPYATGIEAVYISAINGQNATFQDFTKRAQERVLQSLNKGVPLN